jgi:GNAT superfamily N-acetyltransferase
VTRQQGQHAVRALGEHANAEPEQPDEECHADDASHPVPYRPRGARTVQPCAVPAHASEAALRDPRAMQAKPPGVAIRRVHGAGERELAGLCDLLIDCVEGGASVSFVWPMTRAKAQAFWSDALAAAARGERVVLVAEDVRSAIVGTVQLVLQLPENQPHRADLAKMLVQQSARRQGIGAQLLRAAEAAALDIGKTLLVLDTVTGDPGERLYARHGWQRVGEIPGYALYPDGRPCATTVFYRSLRT